MAKPVAAMPTKGYYSRDIALWFFGLGIILFFIVSGPATFGFVEPFHNDGSWYGPWAAGAFFMALELGAIGSKLAALWLDEDDSTLITLNWTTIGLLTLTSFANFVTAMVVFAAAKVTGPMAYIQQTPILYYASCVIYAGLVPTLLYLFLNLFVKRFKKLRGDIGDASLQVRRMMEPVTVMTQQFSLLMQAMKQIEDAQGGPRELDLAGMETRIINMLQGSSQRVLDVTEVVDAMQRMLPAPAPSNHDAILNALDAMKRDILEQVDGKLRAQGEELIELLQAEVVLPAEDAPPTDEDEVRTTVEHLMQKDDASSNGNGASYHCLQCEAALPSKRKQQHSKNNGCPQCVDDFNYPDWWGSK